MSSPDADEDGWTLPPGWVVRGSRSQPGRICYLNLITGKRQFARPTARTSSSNSSTGAALEGQSVTNPEKTKPGKLRSSGEKKNTVRTQKLSPAAKRLRESSCGPQSKPSKSETPRVLLHSLASSPIIQDVPSKEDFSRDDCKEGLGNDPLVPYEFDMGDVYGERANLQPFTKCEIGNSAIDAFGHCKLLSRIRIGEMHIELGSCVLYLAAKHDAAILKLDQAKSSCPVAFVREIRVPRDGLSNPQLVIHRLFRASEMGEDDMPSLILTDKPSLLSAARVVALVKVAYQVKMRRYCDFSCFHVWRSASRVMEDISKASIFLPTQLAEKVIPRVDPQLMAEGNEGKNRQETRVQSRSCSTEPKSKVRIPAPPIVNRDIAQFDILQPVTWTAESVDWNV